MIMSGMEEPVSAEKEVNGLPAGAPSLLSPSLVQEVQQSLFEAVAPIAKVHKSLVILHWDDDPEPCKELIAYIVHYVPEYCKTKGSYDIEGHYNKVLSFICQYSSLRELFAQQKADAIKDIIRPLLLACAVQLLTYYVKEDDPRIEDIQDLKVLYGEDPLFYALSVGQWQTMLKIYNAIVLAKLLLPLQRNCMVVLKAAGMLGGIWNSCFNSGNLGCTVRCCRAMIKSMIIIIPKPATPPKKPKGNNRRSTLSSEEQQQILNSDSLDSASSYSSHAPPSLPTDYPHQIMSSNGITDMFSFDDYDVVEAQFSVIAAAKNAKSRGGVGTNSHTHHALLQDSNMELDNELPIIPSPGMENTSGVASAALPIIDYPSLDDEAEDNTEDYAVTTPSRAVQNNYVPSYTSKCAVCKIHDVHSENLCLWCIVYHKQKHNHAPLVPNPLATRNHQVNFQHVGGGNMIPPVLTNVLQSLPITYMGKKRNCAAISSLPAGMTTGAYEMTLNHDLQQKRHRREY